MSSTRKELDPLSSLVASHQESKPVPPRAPSPAELAKILARAAIAKSGAPKPLARAAPAPAPSAPPKLAGIAGAPPPRRGVSAAEALEVARRSEEERPVAAAARPPAASPSAGARPTPTAKTQLTDAAQEVISQAFAGVPFFVSGAWLATDRRVLTALWKANRTRFAAARHLDAATAVGGVLNALSNTGDKRLLAAHVLAESNEFLAWIDLDSRTVLAAFPDARSLLTGLDGA